MNTNTLEFHLQRNIDAKQAIILELQEHIAHNEETISQKQRKIDACEKTIQLRGEHIKILEDTITMMQARLAQLS